MPKGIWFPAKRYGWGWGLPCAWQGWVVLGLWLAVLAGGILGILVRAPEGWAIPLCCLFLLLMAAVLMGLCAWRGEKPRWRWGDSD
ncbi:MAG: hypothetical protein MUP47_05130 [Phycisphaerae bacterium]|nr:hypothetical protein [Phycisphaerae bacterium]